MNTIGGKKGLRRAVVMAGMVLACMISARPGIADDGGIYVAGQGMPLADVLTQALAENPAPGPSFWVIVAGEDIVRVTRAGAQHGVEDDIRRVIDRGGFVYACRPDMIIFGVAPGQLLSGVLPFQGFSALPIPEDMLYRQPGIVFPNDPQRARLMLRTCADRDAPNVFRARWTRMTLPMLPSMSPSMSPAPVPTA